MEEMDTQRRGNTVHANDELGTGTEGMFRGSVLDRAYSSHCEQEVCRDAIQPQQCHTEDISKYDFMYYRFLWLLKREVV